MTVRKVRGIAYVSLGEVCSMCCRCKCGTRPRLTYEERICTFYQIKCPKCGKFVLCESLKGAIRAWNKRVCDCDTP